MDDSGGNSEDQKDNRNSDSKDCAHEVSDEQKTLLGIRLEATDIHVTSDKELVYILSMSSDLGEGYV
jgi:hypothetical protein